MKLVLLLSLLLSPACRRPAASGGTVEYRAPDGSFTARLPPNWKADEAPGETRKAVFFGPPDGAQPFSQMMGVYFHAAPDPAASARAFLSSETGAAPAPAAGEALETVVEREVPDPHRGAQRTVTRTVAVPSAGGFFTLVHVYPAGSRASASFDELVSTFKPAAK